MLDGVAPAYDDPGKMGEQVSNTLFYGDNLGVLRNREYFPDQSIDLIYLDPPFNSNASYNVLFKGPSGKGSGAQIEAFEDTWHWGEAAEDAFDQVMHSGHVPCADMLRSMRGFLGENDMMAYLAMMAIRLIELRRVLKPSGGLYLHCDPTASHYLKILLDAIFGKELFLNELIWKRTSSQNNPRRYGPVHDCILFFAKNQRYKWNPIYEPAGDAFLKSHDFLRDADGKFYRMRDLTGGGLRTGHSGQPWRNFDPSAIGRHWAVSARSIAALQIPPALTTQQKLDLLDAAGLIYVPQPKSRTLMPMPRLKLPVDPRIPARDVIVDINPINSQADERLGFPTQKPIALVERLISASSDVGDTILDPFCGCGTAIHAAQRLSRNWIGIDITHLAISLIERRLRDAFPGISFDVHGTPKDIDAARDLAARDRYQFQWWAVSLVNAQPYGGKKKGADTGIDGKVFFKPDGKRTEVAIVSVKSGGVGVTMIRELQSVIQREKAPMGLFLTLSPPTEPMRIAATAAGFYETLWGKHPRIQILTIAELLDGKRPDMPLVDVGAAFRAAPRESQEGDQQELTV